MPLRTCTYAGCQAPAERRDGSCTICAGHFCSQHRLSPFHACPDEENDADAWHEASNQACKRHLDQLLRKVDAKALKKLASDLRQGVACRVPAFESDEPDAIVAASQMGGQNCHVDLVFEDGIVWLARLHLEDPVMAPDPVQDYIFASEIATLKFLETTQVPSPRVFYHAVKSSTNAVGATFSLLEKFAGHPLHWNAAHLDQKNKVVKQLVDVQMELAKHSFPSAGSLLSAKDGSFTVGPYAQSILFTTPEEGLGPFTDLRTALSAFLEQQKDRLISGEQSAFPVDGYLSMKWREDALAKLVDANEQPMGFYLKNNDDKGDHILVDDDFNITGLIDWEFATLEPAGYAFSSPCMMWDVASFFAGSNDLTAEELEYARLFEQRDRPDLAACVRNGRMYQRFIYFLASLGYDQDEFEALFQSLRQAFSSDNSTEHDDQIEIESFAQWREQALAACDTDQRLQQLLQRSGPVPS